MISFFEVNLPSAKNVLNAFTAAQVKEITGLSVAMIDYLLRAGFLHPAYTGRRGRRGYVRYYSYRDLLAAQIVQNLRATGVQLNRLKTAVQAISKTGAGILDDDPVTRLTWLVSDGREVHLRNNDGFLDSLGPNGQRSFAFIVNLDRLADEVRSKLPEPQINHFSLRNNPLRYESRQAA